MSVFESTWSTTAHLDECLEGIKHAIEVIHALRPLPEIYVTGGLPFTKEDGTVIHAVTFDGDDYTSTPEILPGEGIKWRQKRYILCSQELYDRALAEVSL